MNVGFEWAQQVRLKTIHILLNTTGSGHLTAFNSLPFPHSKIQPTFIHWRTEIRIWKGFGMGTVALRVLSAAAPLPFHSAWEPMLGATLALLKTRGLLLMLVPRHVLQAKPSWQGQTILPSLPAPLNSLLPGRSKKKARRNPRPGFVLCLIFPSSTSTALFLMYSKMQFMKWLTTHFIICP